MDESVATAADAVLRLRAPSAFVVSVVSGAEAGARHELDETASALTIGTSVSCDLRLSDRGASRRHASIEWLGTFLRVRDLGSTNGTFVNGVKIVEAEICGGETLRIGSSTLQVESKSARGADAPAPVVASFGQLVGSSVAMRRIYPLCARLANADVPVVIEGETGTGKEVLAESLHESGTRRSGPFVVFDCTAVPTSLAESELFGHERGAFTGAVSTRLGVFEQANHGTLFIDEIGDLEPNLQPKLLRALERSEVRRVGGDRWIEVDVRVIAATRRNLDKEVELGRFRDDLFHRLAVARIEMPPLRDRREDIPALARHLWQTLGGVEPLPDALIARLRDEPWPGNVRELRNAVARHLALGDLETPTAPARDSSVSMETLLASDMSFIEARDRLVEEFERRFVDRLLAEHGGDSARAAAASGIGRRYFQKLRKRSSR